MAEIKSTTTRDEITEEQLLEIQKELKGIFGEEPQSVASSKSEMIFAQEPMLLEDEECIKYMEHPKFVEGFEYGLKLAGIYTALASFGAELGTINDIILTEHTKVANIELQKVMNEGASLQAIKAEKNQL